MSLLAELSVKKNTRHACFPSRYLKSEKNVVFFQIISLLIFGNQAEGGSTIFGSEI
jgi:hypothetical protein